MPFGWLYCVIIPVLHLLRGAMYATLALASPYFTEKGCATSQLCQCDPSAVHAVPCVSPWHTCWWIIKQNSDKPRHRRIWIFWMQNQRGICWFLNVPDASVSPAAPQPCSLLALHKMLDNLYQSVQTHAISTPCFLGHSVICITVPTNCGKRWSL